MTSLSKLLKAEGVEGHVEELGFLRIARSTGRAQQPAVEHRLRAFHARSAAQQRTGVFRFRLVHEESWMT